MKFFIKIFLCLILLQSHSAFSIGVGVGLSAVETGDDRFQPSVLGHIDFAKHFVSRLHYFGRKYGPINERTVILSTAYELDVMKMFGNSFLKGEFGLSVVNEATELKFDDDDSESSTQYSTNGGFVIGMNANLPVPGPAFVIVSFEGHYFISSIDSTVAMATGRMGMLSLISGVRF